MSNETTNQKTTSTDLDNFKEYLKKGLKLKCPKYNTEYNTYKIISLFGPLIVIFLPLRKLKIK